MENARVPVLVIGSANTDHIVFSKDLPRPGETVSGGHYRQAFGGKGANQAVAAARAGAEVCFLSCLGCDSAGISYLENLKLNGIDTRFVRQTESAASGIALIMVDEKGENCISVAPGANLELRPEDLENALSDGQYSMALLQMEIPAETAIAAIEMLYQEQIPVVLNLAPFTRLKDEVLRKVSILVLNETEAAGLSGMAIEDEASASEAASILFGKLGIPRIILSLGAAGALLCEMGEISLHPAFKVKVKDSTAAGDTFCGYLGAGLAKGLEVAAAIRFAQGASALCVGKEGAQPSIPLAGEVQAFLGRQAG